MVRTPCCEKAHTNKGAWTKEEDQLLLDYIRLHGEGNWRSLPKAAGLLRCGKSCRLRWINYLRPDVKRGNFSAEEDEIIIKLHSLLGNRWSLIAGRLPGRTDNEIKNYWNTHIRRKLISSGIDPQTHRPLNSATKAGRNFINSIPPPPPPPLEEKVMISMIEPTKILSFPATDNSSSIHDTNCNSSTTEESQPPPPPPQEEENGVDALDLELSIGLPFQSKYTKAASFKLRRPAAGIVQFKAAAEVAPPPPSMCVCRALGFQKDRFCSICQCRNRSYRYC